MSRAWLVVAALLAGCGDNDQMIPRDRACQEQAYAWCSHTDGGSGCWYAYVYPCALPGDTGLIPETSQDRCLDAMSEVDESDPVPTECRALWATR